MQFQIVTDLKPANSLSIKMSKNYLLFKRDTNEEEHLENIFLCWKMNNDIHFSYTLPTRLFSP